MKNIYYKGKGNHSVNDLEKIVEQQKEELHQIKSGQTNWKLVDSDSLHNVSGLFVLFRTNGILEEYWDGEKWDHTKVGCPQYTWGKANEYGKVMGCSFTDA